MKKGKVCVTLNIFALMVLFVMLGGCGQAESTDADTSIIEGSDNGNQGTGLSSAEGAVDGEVSESEDALLDDVSEGRTERVDNPDGGWSDSEYDEAGDMVKQTCYDSDGNLKQVSEYEDASSGSRLQKETYYNISGKQEKTVTYSYNTDGGINEITEYDGTGKQSGILIYDYNDESILKGIFELDADNIQVKYTAYNTDGEIEYYDTDYEYDAAGNCVGQSTYDAEGNLQCKTKFNADLQAIECCYYDYAYYNNVPKMVGYTHEKYDDTGKVIDTVYIELESASELAGEPVQQKETDHFVFWCTNQDVEVLDALAEALEGCYSRVTSDLGKAPSEKTEVRIAPGLRAYHEMIGRPDDPDWSVGEARDGTVYMVSPLNPGPSHGYDDMIIVAVHEYVHVVVAQFNRKQPSYLNEGIASYEAGQGRNAGYYVRNDAENGTLPVLADFTGSGGFIEVDDAGKAYAYAHIYVNFIVDTSGFDAVISLLEGKSLTEALGMGMEELDEKWMDYLASYVN